MYIVGLLSSLIRTKLVVYAQPLTTSRCPSLLVNIQHYEAQQRAVGNAGTRARGVMQRKVRKPTLFHDLLSCSYLQHCVIEITGHLLTADSLSVVMTHQCTACDKMAPGV